MKKYYLHLPWKTNTTKWITYYKTYHLYVFIGFLCILSLVLIGFFYICTNNAFK